MLPFYTRKQRYLASGISDVVALQPGYVSFVIRLAVKGWWHRETREWNTTRKHHLKQLSTLRKEAGGRPLVDALCFTGRIWAGLAGTQNDQKTRWKRLHPWVFFRLRVSSNAKHRPRRCRYLFAGGYSNQCPTSCSSFVSPAFIGVKYEFWWNYLGSLIREQSAGGLSFRQDAWKPVFT